MIDIEQLQKDVWANKIAKGFNTTDVEKEFNLTNGELAEAYDAYRKKKSDVGEELADVVIFILGLSEMLGIQLESEILKKVEKNYHRVYENVNGVNVRLTDDRK